MMWMTSFV